MAVFRLEPKSSLRLKWGALLPEFGTRFDGSLRRLAS